MGRSVFFGTPAWAVPSLDALAASDWDVVAVVTNADRPAGRGYRMQAPPVKERALELGIEVHQPEKARDPGFQAWLESVAPDVAVVVAYGKILPGRLLEVPRLGFVNVHFSLLPEYRGAAPVQRAIADGKQATGIALMVLTEGMDEGPVLVSETVPIDPDETAGHLGERMALVGGRLLVPTLEAYSAGRIRPEEQDHSLATYAPKITPEEARIDWAGTAQQVKDQVRALNPVPGAWTTFRGDRMKIQRVALATAEGEPSPGETALEGDRWLIGTGEGAVTIEEAQLAGKRRLRGSELARGLRPSVGETFG